MESVSFDQVLGFIMAACWIPIIQFLDTKTMIIGEIIRVEFFNVGAAIVTIMALTWLAYPDLGLSMAEVIDRAFWATGVGTTAIGVLKGGNHMINKK